MINAMNIGGGYRSGQGENMEIISIIIHAQHNFIDSDRNTFRHVFHKQSIESGADLYMA